MDRMYSILTVKTVEEDERIIRGIATTPAPDRVGDVVEPLGVKFKNPMPLLHQHDHDKPVGTVKFDRPTKDGITFEATLPKITEPGPLKDRVDTAWGEVKAGLVRAVSIGFRALEYAFIDGGGIRFSETEVMELSLVSVPANAQAVISTIKSIDRPVLEATGKAPTDADRPAKDSAAKPAASGTGAAAKPPGVSGKSVKPVMLKEKQAMTLAEQIAALEAKRAAHAGRMEAILQKSADEGRSTDAAEQEEFDTLSGEVTTLDADLKRFRALEATKAAGAKPVIGATAKDATQSRDPLIPAKVKLEEKLEKGLEFARYAMCLVSAKGDEEKAFRLAERHYPNSERIVKTLRAQADGASLEKIMKAAVEAGTTLDATWAAPLVDYQNFAGDFVEFLRPRTILGQFGAGNIPSLNRIPFNVRIPGQTSGGQAYWVGEGAPKPLTQFDFNATELRWAKIATIAVLTEELIRFSDPSAERLVRDGLSAAVIERMDLDFTDPAKAAGANVSPASITNGVTPIVSSGNDADAVRADLKALWAPFITAKNPPRQAVYIMDSTTALSLSLMTNPLGQPEFPGLTMNGGTLAGVPVIVSDYVARTAEGGMVILVNASDIWLADDGQVVIDASREASLQMLDNPTNNSATGTPTTMVSMFQTNSVAFRAERFVNWAKRRASAVSVLSEVNWGAPASTGG